MSVRYIDLVNDHALISERAAALLTAVDVEGTDAGDVANALHDLGRIVRDHLVVEAPVADALDRAELQGPWLATWQQQRESYVQLTRDWQNFLSEWDEPAIEADFESFRLAAHRILDRLEERVDLESRTFYAVALQAGKLQFHLV